ncbi:MAG: aminopeptidase P family protein [Bacteroidota bacterium]
MDILDVIRSHMEHAGIDACIFFNKDPHQNKYLADHWKIIPWLTGFTGSNATVVITATKAGLWTDFRYFIQAEQQLAGRDITLFKAGLADVPTHVEWLQSELKKGSQIGVDGHVFTNHTVMGLEKTFSKLGIRINSSYDPVTELWSKRPVLPTKKIFEHDIAFAGVERADKLSQVREQMNTDYLLLTALDQIAWILNLRGQDISFNPVFFSYLLIGPEEGTLFIEAEKLDQELIQTLAEAGIQIAPYESVATHISSLAEGSSLSWENIPESLFMSIPEQISTSQINSPVTLLKAVKNEVEISNIRKVMIKDGVALVKFLIWLAENLEKTPITELTAAQQLEAFRSEQTGFVTNSFQTISGYNGHGAIVHYAVTEETASTLEPTGLYLLDSGGQYLNGTTDITRTVALGSPNKQQKKDFTLVLKGHIRLALAIYPEGTKGYQLDSLAREALWREQLNYGHGTGHGVGFFLNVHEGPQNLGASGGYSMASFKEGMLTSNEPGIYREGQYGIRIENLVLTVNKGESEFGTFLGFETLSLCPIDTSLVERSMLTEEERKWLNTYHRHVFETLVPHLTTSEERWLSEATMPL